jgi:hypothetical protein
MYDLHQVKSLVDSVMQSMSSARQSEVKAWEEEFLPCEHTLTLQQLATGHIPTSGMPLHLFLFFFLSCNLTSSPTTRSQA